MHKFRISNFSFLLQVTQQALMNIRTVASLGKEDYFYQKFSQLLQDPYPYETVFIFIYT